ncbi:MAG: ATP-binding cassette domain-containing protein [Acetobacteraceae bacterium]|nr:ATP-binding cassette domain-containing protein [Acetobacteraceae bacterium]
MIIASGIGVRRGGRWLLRGIDCVVEPGRVLALVGPNGAGKSTLLAVLSGAIVPDEGSVRLDGRPLRGGDAASLARRRAVMAQSARAAFPLTARQTVALGRMAWHGSPGSADDEAAIEAAMAEADILHLRSRDMATLSGGEAARTHFARALAQLASAEPPAALLLDEPTASLDAGHKALLLRAARGLAARGIAVAIVLHDLNEARFVADQVLLLDDGRAAAHGAPDSVLLPDVLQPVYGVPFLSVGDAVLAVFA